MRRLIFMCAVLLAHHGALAHEAVSKPDWCDYAWDAEKEPVPPRLNLPHWACEVAVERELSQKYSPMVEINPFFLTGDFDGDHRSDIAIWIKRKRTGEYGLAVIHYKDKRLFLIGAGNATERGKDLRGFDSWTLLPKENLESPYEEELVTLRGDAIMLTKSDSASVAVYWNGKSYGWYQIGD